MNRLSEGLSSDDEDDKLWSNVDDVSIIKNGRNFIVRRHAKGIATELGR